MNRKPRNYWTKERCHEIALKYEHKRDFKKNNCSCYGAAQNHGWIDEICGHMKPLNNAYRRCIYSIEFIESKSVYVGLTYSMEVRQAKRRTKASDSVTKYIYETGYEPIIKQLTDYLPVVDAIKLEEEYLQQYKNNGWNILNRAKTGGIGCPDRKHRYSDLEYVKTLIPEYKSVIDLMNRNNALYLKIRDYGWRDIIYPMLNYKKRYPTSFWTKENLIEYSKKFNTAKEFEKEFIVACRIARKNGWFNEIKIINKWK